MNLCDKIQIVFSFKLKSMQNSKKIYSFFRSIKIISKLHFFIIILTLNC